MRKRSALWSVAGPGAFAVAAVVSGRREPGYRRRDEPISALAARGAETGGVMVAGFLGLGVGSLGLAAELRGTRVAPPPVPALLGLAGLTTAGAGLARCSSRRCPSRFLGDEDATLADELHGAFSMATFALWTALPLVAAQKAKLADARYRQWSRRLGVFTFVSLLVGGNLARSPSRRWSGTAQRVMLASALAWYPLAGTMA